MNKRIKKKLRKRLGFKKYQHKPGDKRHLQALRTSWDELIHRPRHLLVRVGPRWRRYIPLRCDYRYARARPVLPRTHRYDFKAWAKDGRK